MDAKRNPLFLSSSFFELSPIDEALSQQCVKEIRYEEVRNGSYEGKIVHHKRQGIGIFIWDDSSVYVGEWMNDQCHGKGALFLRNGASVFGAFENGKLNGKAVMRFATGSRILGHWRQNQLNGVCFVYESKIKEWMMCECRQGVSVRIMEKQQLNGQNDSVDFFSASLDNSPYEYVNDSDIPVPQFNQLPKKDVELLKLSGILHQLSRLSEKTQSDKKLEVIKMGPELHYLGFTQNEVPEGLGITFQEGVIKNVGAFNVKFFYSLVISYTLCNNQQGVMEGLGRTITEDGVLFDGEFVKGHMEGVGFLYNSTTDLLYEGVFSESQCGRLFRKQEGLNIQSILKHRATIHKQSPKFRNQIYELEIIDALTASLGGNDIHDLSTDILSRFVQQNDELFKNRRNNLFFFPKQITLNETVDISSLPNHINSSSGSFKKIPPLATAKISAEDNLNDHLKYREYQFSLQEFQNQLRKPLFDKKKEPTQNNIKSWTEQAYRSHSINAISVQPFESQSSDQEYGISQMKKRPATVDKNRYFSLLPGQIHYESTPSPSAQKATPFQPKQKNPLYEMIRNRNPPQYKNIQNEKTIVSLHKFENENLNQIDNFQTYKQGKRQNRNKQKDLERVGYQEQEYLERDINDSLFAPQSNHIKQTNKIFNRAKSGASQNINDEIRLSIAQEAQRANSIKQKKVKQVHLRLPSQSSPLYEQYTIDL